MSVELFFISLAAGRIIIHSADLPPFDPTKFTRDIYYLDPRANGTECKHKTDQINKGHRYVAHMSVTESQSY